MRETELRLIYRLLTMLDSHLDEADGFSGDEESINMRTLEPELSKGEQKDAIFQVCRDIIPKLQKEPYAELADSERPGT